LKKKTGCQKEGILVAKAKKITPEELGKILSGKPIKKKKSEKKAPARPLSSVKASPKKKPSKERKEKNLKALDIIKSKKAPLVVSKKTGTDREKEIEKWLATEPGFLEGLTSDVLGVPTKLYSYQIRYLLDRSFFIHIDKARQTGYSYIYAGRSLAKAHLQHHQTSIFISINQEEANEKIVYARGLYESMPLSVRKKVVVDNKQTLEFEDKNGKYTSRTRIISHAQREPRGKGGNVDVYLDEAAHYSWGEAIYVAAVPIITRGSGTLTIGSSPLGKKGIHYDIIAKEAFRRIYSYHQVYWWDCIDFVKVGKFKEARKLAPNMSSEERVAKFGSEKLIGIFISMDIEQFQQEYELLHIDESVSFFPIDLINKCVYEVVLDEIFLSDDEYSEKLTFPIVEKYPHIDLKLYEDLDSLMKAVQAGKVSPNLFAGYDVGRKSNNGEFSIIEEVKTDMSSTPLQVIRHLQTFRNKKFKYQKAYLKKCLDDLPRLKMKIDSGGIGEDMAEELADYSWRVDPIHFSNEWKEETCADFRIRLEEQLIAIPNKKDVKNQIHSIKRKVTESGRFIFDAEKNKEHHGDIFWSIAMASSLGERAVKSRISIPSTGEEKLITSPRIIPISMARSFTRVNLPKARMPLGAAGLRAPENIKLLHSRGVG
jgi:phage FluMu gp28-like protein